MANSSARLLQSLILSSHPGLSFLEKPDHAKDRAVKAKPISFLKQIVNSIYFLWRLNFEI